MLEKMKIYGLKVEKHAFEADDRRALNLLKTMECNLAIKEGKVVDPKALARITTTTKTTTKTSRYRT